MAEKKKVPERRSGLRPSEKELPERRSGAFRHKNTRTPIYNLVSLYSVSSKRMRLFGGEGSRHQKVEELCYAKRILTTVMARTTEIPE
jgi:hypothetical protein